MGGGGVFPCELRPPGGFIQVIREVSACRLPIRGLGERRFSQEMLEV